MQVVAINCESTLCGLKLIQNSCLIISMLCYASGLRVAKLEVHQVLLEGNKHCPSKQSDTV